MEKWPIGVFASIDAGLGLKLEVAHELGVSTIQLHAPHRQTRTPENARRFLDRLRELGISLTAVFGGFDGESYADIPTVVRTVGLVPPTTRSARLGEMKEIADFAKLLNCNVAALHLGVVPHDRNVPLYGEVLAVTRDLCDHCRAHGQSLHLETGQEPAGALLQFIQDVERDNLFVNFDPANMILYDKGDPIAALRTLGPWIRQVHIKDARRTKVPGTWGEEVTVGTGEVDWRSFFATLRELNYTGDFVIEREAGNQRAADIRAAKDLVVKM